MSRPSKTQKINAAETRKFWERVARAVAFATAGSALSSAGNPLVSAALLKVGAFLHAIANGFAGEAGQIAADPPRRDFETGTYAVVRKLDYSVFGEDRITTSALAVGVRLNEGTGYLRALIRALERSEGARIHDAPSVAEARVYEAVRFAERASRILDDLSARSMELAGAFSEATDRGSVSEGERSSRLPVWVRLDEVLPDSSLSALYRSGIRIEEIRKGIRGGSVEGVGGHQISEELRAASTATHSLAQALRNPVFEE